MKETKNIFKYY